MSIGIYKILNIINNKVYIGSSINIERRFYEHLRHLKENYHINKHLQNAYNKYGENSFKFSIIVNTKESILRRAEQLYINKFQADNPKYGYNKAVVISNTSNFKKNQVIIKLDSNYIGCYDKNGKIVKVFRNIGEVYIFLGNKFSRVYEAINSNLTKTANSYYWIRIDISRSKFPNKIIPKIRKGRHRKIKQYDLNDNFIKEWNSAIEAAHTLRLSSFNITRCLKKNNIYKKFKWLYSAP